MNIISKIGTIFLIFISFVLQVHAEPLVSYSYNYYFINPRHSMDLNNALDKASPIRAEGKIFRGNTKWHVRWKFWFDEENGDNCKISKVDTTVDVTYTMPKLQPGMKSDPYLVPRFQEYFDALMVHEKGHAENGINAAREVEYELINLEPQACQNITAIANTRGQQVLQKYNQKDIEYDNKTQHGRTQGAFIK